MADRELRLRIGAAVDASFSQVLADVVEQAKKANRQIAADKRAAKEEATRMAKEQGRAETEARRNAAAEARAIAKEVNAQLKAEDNALLAAKKANLKQEEQQERKMAKLRKELAAEARRDAIATERANKQASDAASAAHKKSMDYWKSSISGGVTKGLGIAAGLGYSAVRMASGAAQAMGYDLDAGSQLSKSVHRQSLSQEVSMQGYIGSGKGPEGSNKMIDRDEISTKAREVGNATGTATEDVLEGLNKFTQMTGDLQTALDLATQIGKVAKANGASFQDVALAAANTSIAMGDVDDKSKHIDSVLRVIGGQGHLGAVTMNENAVNLGKLASQSHFFKIDPMNAAKLASQGVTNETGQNIAMMGALQQLARRSGGRVTGKEAANSSAAFVADMSSPSQVKKMSAAGLNVYADASHSQVRDPLQMILEVIRKGQKADGGINLDVVNSVFTKKQSKAVMVGAATIYDEAFKKATGSLEERQQKAIEDTTAELQNFLSVTQSTAEIEMKLSKAMSTAESKSIVFNNNMGAVADSLRDTLMPALDAVGPALIDLAGAAADKLADLLGVDSASEKKTYKQIRNVGDATTTAKDIVNGVIQRTPREQKEGGFHVGQSVMTAAQKKEIYGNYESGKAESARLSGTIAELGDKRGGLVGAGKRFKDMSPGELQDEINSVGGNADAKKYAQAVAQQKQLEDNLKGLADAIGELNMWNKAGKILEVKVVSDSTKTPPGAATRPPPNSSTQPPDAATE